MKVGSLFSGVGGLDLGLHRAGHEHVFFCESDAYRRDVLRARWPGVPVFGDVHDIARDPDWLGSAVLPVLQREGREVRLPSEATADLRLADGRRQRQELGRESPLLDSRQARASSGADEEQDARSLDSALDILCGGFPCQDLSVAGRRAGLAGERSGLFFEFARIADALRPDWLLVENVPGLLSSNGGRDFGVLLGTLADIGYGVAWRILDSRFFGVPQRRRRVFIVGALADGDPRAAAERAGEVLAVGSGCDRHLAKGREARPDAPVASLSGLGSGGPDDNDGQGGRLVAPALVKRYGKGTDSDATDAMVAAPLTKGSATGEGVNQPGRRQEDDVNIVAFHATQDPISGDVTPAMGKEESGSIAVSFTTRGRDGEAATEAQTDGVHPALRSGRGGGRRDSGVAGPDIGVRRLTPRECERLQGFPDDWTQLGDTPDSRRYSALGDAVTVNVAEWIGDRLAA